jgi:hypothetical protein
MPAIGVVCSGSWVAGQSARSGLRPIMSLRVALAALSDGDVLLVTRLDRLARSTRDLFNVLDAVVGLAYRRGYYYGGYNY